MTCADIVSKLQDYTHLAWDEKTVTSGTGGTFLKSRSKTSRETVYYKLSCYERSQGVYGHESVNELLASRLLDRLDVPHVPYRLIHARVTVDGRELETWMSESRDYRTENERRQALDTYIDLNAREGESPLEFCKRKGWMEQVHAMMAFDYLIINRDRHGANVEVKLRRGQDAAIAPFFDHGVSFVYSCYDEEEQAKVFEALKDRNVNNYLGSRSLEKNLELLPGHILSGHIISDGADWLLEDLDEALPPTHRTKIREIIERRWSHLIDLGIAEEG